VSGEQPNSRLGGFRYDFCVRLEARVRIRFGNTVSAKLCRGLRGSGRYRMPDDKARLRTEQQRAGGEESARISQRNSWTL
jgi:hypothetical protein